MAATALATRESAMRRRSRSPSGESPAFTLDAMAAAAEASGSGEADELTRVLSPGIAAAAAAAAARGTDAGPAAHVRDATPRAGRQSRDDASE